MRRLFHAQSREKPELDDPSLVSIQSGKALERLVNGEDVSRCWIFALRSGPATFDSFVDGNTGDGPAPFVGISSAGVVDENAAHQLCRKAKKMDAILPSRPALVDEAQI